MRLPPGKMPAFKTNMSRPPNARTPRSSAAVSRPASVTSHAMPRKSGRFACDSTAAFKSSATTAAPRARKLCTHALPMPEAAPVTRTTSPAKGGAVPPLRSLACSRSQYSTSKMSFAGCAFQPPRPSARWITCIVCS